MCEWAPSAGLRTSHRLQGVNGGFLGSWEICMLLSRFRCVQFFATPWTVARQAPLSMGILQARILEWVAIPFSRGSSQPRDGTCVFYVSCIGRQVLHPLSHMSPVTCALLMRITKLRRLLSIPGCCHSYYGMRVRS